MPAQLATFLAYSIKSFAVTPIASDEPEGPSMEHDDQL
jgi:hypothetical protein